ncbi:MAG: hypothetical protein ACI8WB_004629 [Phenylobacterium sp.]|jgi:hypothetical protein
MNKKLPKLLLLSLAACPSLLTWAHDTSHTSVDAHLPPLLPWHGKSESLINTDVKWQTDAERSGLTSTPEYQHTMAYIEKLAAQSPLIRLESIGKSAQGRDIMMVILAKTLKGKNSGLITDNGKPTLLVQAGIHSGEIDGKDAGLMLLRDIVSGKEAGLVEQANLLFIPILSVDGHERSSVYNRVNQRGPDNMGWRTNSRNLNLNRDYSKADTKGIQAVLAVINQYQPDLYLDVHVTDGEDYQYDITYGYNREFASQSPKIARWLDTQLAPYLDNQLTDWGHKPGRLVFGWDGKDFSKGISGWTATPRFSNGYGDLRQLPTILVENHSLKPYRQRVLGTYVFIKSSLEYLAKNHHSLTEVIKADVEQRPKTQVLDWSYDTVSLPVDFDGIDYQRYQDPITGQTEVKWLGEAKHYGQLPQYWQRIPKTEVKVPSAYIIPPQYGEVIKRLRLHGIEMTPASSTAAKTKQSYQQLSVDTFEFDKMPFEGRMRVKATFSRAAVNMTVPAGSMRVQTNQPLGRLATALLQPAGSDSFFSWGFFNPIFKRTEYIEHYAIIPLAEKMLADSPVLKREFEAKLTSDKTFADNARARLDFFYKRTPYYDGRYLKYPVLIEQ